MTSKEALEKVIKDISLEWGYEGIEDELREKLKPLYEDLDKLEELGKENQELKEDFLKPIGFMCRTKEKAMLQNQKLIYLANKYNLPITIIDSETNNKCRKLEKVLEIIKNKKVNMFHIWAFDDYTQYKQHYPFSEYNAEEDMLTTEEFDFLKEWLENDI